MLLWFTYAVLKKSHRMMLPYLILAIFFILFGLISEILLAITIVKPHLPVAQFMMKICYTDMMDMKNAMLKALVR
uniref:Uncharacterized protein n=1 Tax=Acrobeloides nanus TaxID=290746 RepID=A0A914CJ27_9BILA